MFYLKTKQNIVILEYFITEVSLSFCVSSVSHKYTSKVSYTHIKINKKQNKYISLPFIIDFFCFFVFLVTSVVFVPLLFHYANFQT